MYICKMSYSSAMKKRYQLLKRVSIILIFFVLFTKMHAVEPQYAEPQDIQKTETNIEVEEHPQDYIVIKIPFQAKYKPLFICIIVLALSFICFFIIYPLLLYVRESKRKRTAQRELTREKELLSLSLEKSNIYAWKYIEKTNAFICDKEFFEHLDMPFRAFTLQEMAEAIHPEDRVDVLNTFYHVKNQPDSKTHTQCRCNFNGKGYIWYELRYVNPTEAMAETASIIGLITNVQHFKDKEEELMRAKDLAIEAELKQSFLANMSHEIRTPLNALSGFSSLLTEENLDNETRRQCNEVILQNSELLLKLINDVIDLSSLEFGKIQFCINKYNVVNICRNVIDTVSKIKQTQAAICFITELESMDIETDDARLQQVLINLLINATKFTSQGSIILELRKQSEQELLFFVTDTGCGIPKEKQAAIFRRFEKLNENAQGSGLGLSICQLIIEHIGGKIWIDSDYTGGSRFFFTHPIRQSQSTNPKKENNA